MRQIAIGIGTVLAGCTVSQPQIKPAVSQVLVPVERPTAVLLDGPSAYTYELLTPAETKLLLVFDDGHRTYLTFSAPVPLGLLIFDEGGRPVSFTVGDRTVIVEGVRAGLLLRTPTQMSYAQAPSRAALGGAPSVERGEEEGAPWLPAELAAARAEILRAEQRLRGVAAELDKASRGEPSATFQQLRSEIEAIQTAINGVTATLVRAHFASGSALLALSAEAKTAILAAAARAEEIRIRGGTDNVGPAAVNERLARARAESMRRVLLEGGIAAEKLHTSPSQGAYIATNATVSGRALNRRVDVVFANRSEEEATPVAQSKPGPMPGAESLSGVR
jgi:outer membrane protein OmpA-like peptidoglycan-associated protein